MKKISRIHKDSRQLARLIKRDIFYMQGINVFGNKLSSLMIPGSVVLSADC